MCCIKINQVQLKETVSISAYIPATCSLLHCSDAQCMHVDVILAHALYMDTLGAKCTARVIVTCEGSYCSWIRIFMTNAQCS